MSHICDEHIFRGEQSKEELCNIPSMYISGVTESHPIIYGFTDPIRQTERALTKRGGTEADHLALWGSPYVSTAAGMIPCVAYCPRLFIVANVIQFQGSAILRARVRDMRNLPMIQIPLVSFPFGAGQITRYIDMKSRMILDSLLYGRQGSYSLVRYTYIS
ncbi:hypothetical protein ACS0PU_009411 [Formica fusca]